MGRKKEPLKPSPKFEAKCPQCGNHFFINIHHVNPYGWYCHTCGDTHVCMAMECEHCGYVYKESTDPGSENFRKRTRKE